MNSFYLKRFVHSIYSWFFWMSIPLDKQNLFNRNSHWTYRNAKTKATNFWYMINEGASEMYYEYMEDY